MNRENAKKLLPIITAFADGKVIEWKNSDGVWVVADSPGFSYNPNNYRIKREPKEIWVNEYSDGSRGLYADAALALAYTGSSATRKAVRYREVLED